MINLSRVVQSPRFSQAFAIKRESRSIAAEGRVVVGAPVVTPCYGVVTPAKTADVLLLLPEGERIQNAIRVFAKVDVTQGDGVGVQPDVIVWNGSDYRVLAAKPWGSFGFSEVMAVQLVRNA